MAASTAETSRLKLSLEESSNNGGGTLATFLARGFFADLGAVESFLGFALSVSKASPLSDRLDRGKLSSSLSVLTAEGGNAWVDFIFGFGPGLPLVFRDFFPLPPSFKVEKLYYYFSFKEKFMFECHANQ